MRSLLHEARCALPPAQVDEIFDGFERAGFHLDYAAPSWARSDGLVVVRAVRYNPAFPPRELAAAEVAALRAMGETAKSGAEGLSSALPEGVASALVWRRGPPKAGSSTWLPVWDGTRMISTGIELHVSDDDDASCQLDALAEALPDLDRLRITIKPRRGWQGYGLPGRL